MEAFSKWNTGVVVVVVVVEVEYSIYEGSATVGVAFRGCVSV